METPTTTQNGPATAKQQSYLDNLIATRPTWAATVGLAPEGIANLSFEEASDWIESARSVMPEREQHPDAIPLDKLEEGPYWTLDGDIVRVRRSKRGHLYGEQLDPNEGQFEYKPGIILRLKARMTLDEAKEWGARFGRCCVCGNLLTVEKSMQEGIGPVCARRF